MATPDAASSPLVTKREAAAFCRVSLRTFEREVQHLVVALGASTNDGLIPGSSNALTFKIMADALFQMPRWDRRLRIVLDWTIALFFRPDITRVDLRVEREQVEQTRQLSAGPQVALPASDACAENASAVAQR